MKIQDIVIISAIAMVLLSGCATLSENQCRLGDWEGIGFSDGSNGYTLGRFEEHQKACAEYGVAPKLQEYQRGYEKGLAQYCVPSNGYVIGRQGKAYYGVCTGPGSDQFVQNYYAGKREYEVKTRLDEISRKMDEIDKKLMKTDIDKKEKESLWYQRKDLEREKNTLLIEAGAKGFFGNDFRGGRW